MDNRQTAPDEILNRHGIRPTSVRILIYKTMNRFHDTFSMADLEEALDSVDKMLQSF